MVSDGQTMPKTRTGTSASRTGHAGSFHVDFFGSSRNLGEEQLGGASADAQSYWQGRFAACTFVGGFLGVERPKNSWGVAPPPTRELRPLTPQGGFPLDPFFAPQLECISTAICFCSFFPLQPNRFMPQCRHDLRPENLLRKHHRRRIIAWMERNPSFPLHIMVKDQLNPLLLVKPQSQRRQAP